MPCSTLPLSGVNNACGTLLLKRKRRLVINSHPAGSQRRLLELFASLWIAGLHQDWHERIIVMMAGSDNCSIGKQLVSEVLHSVLPRLPFSNQSVVVAHTTVNLWDTRLACIVAMAMASLRSLRQLSLYTRLNYLRIAPRPLAG